MRALKLVPWERLGVTGPDGRRGSTNGGVNQRPLQEKTNSEVQGITVPAEAMNAVISLSRKWTMEMEVGT